MPIGSNAPVANQDAAPKGDNCRPTVDRQRAGLPLVSAVLTILAIIAVTISGYLRFAIFREHPFAYLIHGAGIFELVLGGAALAIAICGAALANRAAEVLPETASATERDDRAIRRYGGALMSAAGAGVGLVLLQGAQSSAPIQGSSTVGFFDLMTWLGTFGTLVVVVCGSLVAVYAKRREDEARQLDSVRNMRQAWINEVRDLLASLMLNARVLADAATRGVVSTDTARLALADLRRLELHLNPTEPHHVVLVEALRSLLQHSSLQGHLGQSAVAPLVPTEWSQLHDWVVALSQLALKIEWVVTSHGPRLVEVKVGTLWKALREYEARNEPELCRLAVQAWSTRMNSGEHLVARSEALPPPIGGDATLRVTGR